MIKLRTPLVLLNISCKIILIHIANNILVRFWNVFFFMNLDRQAYTYSQKREKKTGSVYIQGIWWNSFCLGTQRHSPSYILPCC